MTVLVTEPTITEEERSIVNWIFSQIGRAMFLEEKHIDVATALCGSGPAFACVVLEAMTDGGVMMGIPRAEAQILVAQSTIPMDSGLMIAMQGAARMVLEGQHPAIIRNAVATPGGCTIGGLLTMEDGKIRSTMVCHDYISWAHYRREQFKKRQMLPVD
jgi:pyrroline-5-carboxylate reductase